MVSGNSGLAGRGARACESTATQEGNNATNQKEGGFLCSPPKWLWLRRVGEYGDAPFLSVAESLLPAAHDLSKHVLRFVLSFILLYHCM